MIEVICCASVYQRVWQLAFPFSRTLELPSVRPTGAHSAELAASSCETREHRRTRRENTLSPLPPSTSLCEVDHG
jgi:hypothetical protein